jgi:hypothetical protein
MNVVVASDVHALSAASRGVPSTCNLPVIMNLSPLKLLALGALALLAPACVLIDDSETASQPLEPGYTECGDPNNEYDRYSVCHPNQYCYYYKMGWCSDGCLSNDNCAQDQRCVKTDAEDRGTCQNLKRPTDDPREPANRPGLTLCGTASGEHNTCQLGYYCADPGISACAPGCLSSANCDLDQGCDKAPGTQIGVCADL